jgi:hypothetical protein
MGICCLQAMGLKGSMEAILCEADLDGDGRISLPEFQNLVRQASLGSRNNDDNDVHMQQHRRHHREAPLPCENQMMMVH